MEPEIRKSNNEIIGYPSKIKRKSGVSAAKRRKIRCVKDFDNLNRSSLSLIQSESCVENKRTKKLQNFDFLPKIGLSNEDSKENSPFGSNNSHGKSQKCQLKTTESIGNLHKQLLKCRTEKSTYILSPSVLSPQDEDIVFKPRLKNKHCNSNTVMNEKSPNTLTNNKQLTGTDEVISNCSFNKSIQQKLEQSSPQIKRNKTLIEKQYETKEKGSVENDNNQKQIINCYEQLDNSILSKSIQQKLKQSSPQIETSKTLMEKQYETKEKDFVKNDTNQKQIINCFEQLDHNSILSKSFKILSKNITPDTSGNNQGIFEVTYPIEEEYMNETSLLNLSSLEMKLEKAHNKSHNKLDKTNLPCVNTESKYSEMVTSKYGRTKEKSLQSKFENSRVSIINLITPSPKKQNSLNSDNSLHTPTPTKLSPRCTKTDKNQSLTRKSLQRSATFTKHGDSNLKKNSPKIVNTEKSELNRATPNMRKRWTKSLGVSLLDNSGNFHLISAPNDSLSNSSSNIFSLINCKDKKNVNIQSNQQYFASTPMTSKRNKNVSSNMSANKQNLDSKSIKKTKMPNFAQIHQKAYEKLENIKEMSERKAARAQKLLSGRKPEIGMTKNSPSKSRKALHYSPGIQRLQNLKTSKKVQDQLLQQSAPGKNVLKPIQEKTDILKGKSCIPLPKITSTATSKTKSSKKKSLDKKYILKPGFIYNKSSEKKTTSYQDHLKAVVSKKRIVTETVESRRQLVQNVRTNRRFELLMQMRKK